MTKEDPQVTIQRLRKIIAARELTIARNEGQMNFLYRRIEALKKKVGKEFDFGLADLPDDIV